MNKQDIINTQFDSKEEIIERLYLYSRRNSIDDDLYQKVLDNNPRFNLSLNQLLKAMLDYDDAFYRKIENFARRIEKDRFVRDEGKKLSKFLKNAVSQSKAQGTVARTLSMMLGEVSKIIYESCFTQEDLENLIDLVDDEQHLKIEFENIIMRLIKNVKDFTYGDANFELVSFRTVAEYYVAYYIEDNPSRVKELKQKIKDYIVMSDSDLKKIVDKEIEEVESSQSSELDEDDNHLDSLWSEAMTSLQNNPINDNLSTLDNFNNEKYDELLKDDEWTPEDEKEADNVYKRTIKIYPKYFLSKDEDLDKDEFFDKILFKTINTYFHRKGTKHPNTLSFCSSYLTQCFTQYIEKKMDGKTPENNMHKYMITTDFFLFLAHCLLIGDEEFAIELGKLCFNYIQNNERVAKNYSLFMNEYSQEEHCIVFSPTQMYDNVIVMSVLFELDSDKGIKRAVRRLLLKYYKKIDDFLEAYNKKERKLYYDDNETGDMTYNETVHEYAVTFLFNYFKEPVYVAPFSAFILEFEEMFSLNLYFYHSSSDTIEYIGTEKETNNKHLQKANEYYKEIERILKEAHNVDLSYLENEFSIKYTTLFTTAIQKAYMYDSFLDYDYIIRKNQKSLAMFLIFTDGDIAFGFNDWDIEEKIEFLWENAISISFIKDIFDSAVFLPKIQDLTNDKYTYTLEKKVEQQEETLNEKEVEISLLKSQIRVLKQTNQDINKEYMKDVDKAYYHEISKLNKELKERDETIKKFEENQEELFKLRKLLFELQNNNDSINDLEEINYEDKLLDISNQKKIVCIGGHIRLLAILKDKYPHISFMEVANSVSDRVIRNADYVFFFYNFMSHGTYDKVMNLLKTNNHTKWDYISSKNIDIVEKEMYEKIRKLEN
ncbi:MAG: hypothetical protein ACLSVX_02095 [Massilimicrobiota timonensis]